jgi:hypothetical protein
MASTIAAITTGVGGVVTTADNSGNLSLLSGATTVVAVTSAGVAVTGTLSATGGITASTTLAVTGVSTFAAGTALLPALTTTGDTNTGVWFPAADTIAASTGGTERMRIDTSGRVTMPFQPMFSGYKSATAVAGPAVYILDTMNTNVGSVYSTSTGRFTAPVAGKYLFTSNITSHGAVTRTFAFYVNGVSTVTGIHENAGGVGYFSSIPVDGILTLSASDYVEFYIVNGSGYAGGAYRGFFSGSLIG